MEPAYMRERQLAAYWGISARTLQLWRIEGRGPDYVKFGRCVRYPLRAAAAFELIHLVKRRSIHRSEATFSECPAPPIEVELTPEQEAVLVRMREFLNRTRAVTMRS